jgi:hypothetical protein
MSNNAPVSYKTNIQFHQAPDKALMSIDFVGAFRNNDPFKEFA